MASTKEIKNRIKSVHDTRKITNAMYLIASTKMSKAKKELNATRPYFEMLKKQIINMINMTREEELTFFGERPMQSARQTYGYLVLTADKGLAGAYNQNVIKKTLSLINNNPNYRLFVVGEYGRSYFETHKMAVESEFDFNGQNPTLDKAREITYDVIRLYQRGEISKLFIVYTDFKNGLMGGDATSWEILPFDIADFTEEDADLSDRDEEMEYVPDVATVIDNVVPSYVSGFIYSALVDSFCSEQSARMNAMDSANKNAEELLAKLNLEFNHLRQGAITQEITEISAGSKAQKRGKEKRKEREGIEW